jgi:hypothetical protein
MTKNLRDIIREKGMQEASVDEVIKLITPEIIVAPEDVMDYVLNTGHRHRVIEAWDYRVWDVVNSKPTPVKEYKSPTTHYATNRYPERALFCTLEERAVNKSFKGIVDRYILKSLIRTGHAYNYGQPVELFYHGFKEEIKKLENDAQDLLDTNKGKTQKLAEEYISLNKLVKNTCELEKEMIIKCDDGENMIKQLADKRINFSRDYLREAGVTSGQIPHFLIRHYIVDQHFRKFNYSNTFKECMETDNYNQSHS